MVNIGKIIREKMAPIPEENRLPKELTECKRTLSEWVDDEEKKCLWEIENEEELGRQLAKKRIIQARKELEELAEIRQEIKEGKHDD